MATTIKLGKDYTVSGLTGVTELELTRAGERIDVTTRAHQKPYKKTIAGFPDDTFTCTVLAEDTTKFTIGKAYPVTLNGTSFATLVCMGANREEPQDGIVTYQLTLKPGVESTVANQADI